MEDYTKSLNFRYTKRKHVNLKSVLVEKGKRQSSSRRKQMENIEVERQKWESRKACLSNVAS